MIARAALSTLALFLLTAATIPSTPDLGVAEGRCRANESGPAFIVSAVGMKDRQGRLKLEVYPSNDADFLQDDNILVSAGKVFRRVEVPVPSSGAVELCVRVPAPGAYSVVLLHDRDSNRRFGWTVDGIGFASNPRLGFSRPSAARARAVAGTGPTPISIVMNYRSGLGVAPLPQHR
jgi:uncharacterized protein (DUF2141 family)